MKPTVKDYEVRIWYSEVPGDDCYVAQVNDMPGIMAHGDSREAAAKEIQEALRLALDSYAQNKEEPPAPLLGRMTHRSRDLIIQSLSIENLFDRFLHP